MTNRASASAPALEISVRPMRAEDWQHARCVRLAALADAPDAYGRTLEEELTLSDADWQKRASDDAAGITRCGFLAWIGDVPCGLVVGAITQPGEAELYGLWVAQNIRRSGTGRALVQRVCAWAAERGAQHLSLKVTANNAGAIALYRAHGFEPAEAEQVTCGARLAPALRMHKRVRT